MKDIELISKLLEVNTRWYVNVLEGINEKEAETRISPHGNHLKWIAGHLLSGRYRNASRMGMITEPYPHLDLFIIRGAPPPNGRKIDETFDYPGLQDTINYWRIYSDFLLKALPAIPEESLLDELPFPLPINGKTMLEGLAFTASHEAYHIGQMSIFRKALGHPAMIFN